MTPISTSDYSDLIGTPFTWGGRGPRTFDCYGLVRFILYRCGVQLPNYPSNQDARVNALAIADELSRLQPIDFAVPGAIVIFRMEFGSPTHIGLVVAPDRFIHVLEDCRTVVERLSSPVWKRRIMGFYLWPN